MSTHPMWRHRARLVALATMLGAMIIASSLQSGQAAVRPDPVAAFAVLASPPSAADGAAAGELASVLMQDPTLDVSSARRLLADAQGTLWLLRTTDGRICLAQRLPAGSDALVQTVCNDAAAVAAGGLAAGKPGVATWGVVPDGVDHVQMTDTAGRVSAVAVQNNAYRLPGSAKAVTFSDSAGDQGYTEATAP